MCRQNTLRESTWDSDKSIGESLREWILTKNGFSPKWILTKIDSHQNGFSPKLILPKINSHQNGFSPKWILTKINSHQNGFSLKF